MKKIVLVVNLLCLLAAGTANAQFDSPRGPGLDATTAKLFGDNQVFTARLEMETGATAGKKAVTIPGKLSFDNGKSRFEMNLAEIRGGDLPAGAAMEMKALGMDEIVSISLPEKQTTYAIYPNLKSYLEIPLPAAATIVDKQAKTEIVELGKEDMEGYPCIKNQVTLTATNKSKQVSVVWNAPALKNFPVRIDLQTADGKVTLRFRDVKFAPPSAGSFAAPAGFTKYASGPEMFQKVLIQRMGGAGGVSPRN